MNTVATPIFDHIHPKLFNQLLISMNMYQHAKNHAISSFCCKDLIDLKILQSDWLRTFWFISQETDFSQVWDLYKNTTNNINFLSLQTKFRKN